MSTDLQSFLQYYLIIQLLGLAVWPLTKRLFKPFPDQGWASSKILGLLFATWVIWLLGSLRIASFTLQTSIIVVSFLAVFSYLFLPAVLVFLKIENSKSIGNWKLEIGNLSLILFEELLFLVVFAGWSYVRGFNPDLTGLEKFMDYGFVLSILRGKYFPPLDHFLAGETINYYYFGHLMAAVLVRLSGVIPAIAFNLQIALLFALTVLGAFSAGVALHFGGLWKKNKNPKNSAIGVSSSTYLAGFLAVLFVAVIGNLHAASNVRTLHTYWYPTASRLIPDTINEFPLYSFVVADLHGHVSDIPIVLLIIGLLFSYMFTMTRLIGQKAQSPKPKSQINPKLGFVLAALKTFSLRPQFLILAMIALAIGATYATNSWDYPFFLGLAGLIFLLVEWKNARLKFSIGSFKILVLPTLKRFLPVFILSILLFLPYWLTVRPIGKGIGLVGFVGSFNPKDWQAISKLPLPWYLFRRFIIRSPLNLLFLLWGFYGFFGLSFVVWSFRAKLRLASMRRLPVKILAGVLGLEVKIKKTSDVKSSLVLNLSDLIALVMIGLAFLLILLPEWVYVDDIYKPDYYRANTLFKFYYAAWIILGVATSYGLVRILSWLKSSKKNIFRYLFLLVCALLFASVLLYPIVAIESSTGELKTYKGLNGVASWMPNKLSEDYLAVNWINKNIAGQPTLVEAVGESYTDASRISAMTGLPVVLGWPVHEWLWRGSYNDSIQPISKVQQRIGTVDSVGQRVEEVKQFYETRDLEKARKFLKKYEVKYIYLGKMEKEKYPKLYSQKFASLGQVIYRHKTVVIYKVND